MKYFNLYIIPFLFLGLLEYNRIDNQTTITKKDPVFFDSPKITKNFKIHNPINNVVDTYSKGVYTKIYGFWDYQSNGGSVNYIEVNPNNTDNIHVISMTSTDSIDAISVSMSRKVFYNFSSNGGLSWDYPVSVPLNRSGYPSLLLSQKFDLNLIAVIGSHSTISGLQRSSIYIDNNEGEKFFTSYIVPPHQLNIDDAIWPVITQTTNGNIILAASFPPSSSLAGISVIIFNNNTLSWGTWKRFETSAKHAGRIAIASGSNGYAAVIWYSNTDPDSLLFRQTTDNGNTWSQKFSIDYENGQTGPCWTGFDAIYLGTELYVVYTRSNYIPEGYKLSNEVRLWKSSTQNSIVVLDSICYPYLMKTTGIDNIQTNHNFAFNFPTIGKSTENKIFIGVDVFIQNITDIFGFNYSDILLTYSNNFGEDWSLPINLTKTNDLDERYVSISTINPKIDDSSYVYLVYQEDRIPGANFATLASESRPISGTSLKFLKYNIERKIRDEVGMDIIDSWNMVSLPIDTIEDKSTLFPDAKSNAFTITPGSGYTIQNTLTTGKAYWLKFQNSKNINFNGIIINALEIPVTSGWNMIGGISKPLAVRDITSKPPKIIISPFYGYNKGYIRVDSLYPGKGYWVKSKENGKLILISN